MKKIVMTLLVAWSLILGSTMIANAVTTPDDIQIRFRDNTLVVFAEQMTDARIYNAENGKLLCKSQGNWFECELEKGTYRFYAKIDGRTHARTVIMK